MSALEESILEQIADQLAEQDYAVINDFLSGDEIDNILKVFDIHQKDGKFKKAAIGHTDNKIVDQSVRKDLIKWIENDNANSPTQVFLNRIDAVKDYLNRTCFLGIKEYETHFTIYPPGAYYKKHLDQFNSIGHRKISFICYLNVNWQPEDGGELRMFLPDGVLDIAPTAGKLVCFRSDVVEHEVLVCHANRYSLTGWMLDQYIDLSFL